MEQSRIDALRAQPVQAQSHLIDGARVPASDGGTMEVVSPIDGQVLIVGLWWVKLVVFVSTICLNTMKCAPSTYRC